MPLQAGSRLGPYELAAPIGAGGMGEVWRGRDTRLDRSVAVKILPAGFAQDEERRVRFEREAKTISSLNHPHICTLFDVGREDGTQFLVMELLDGESLADRLQRGPLPLDQVVKFGAQIADALEAAHKQGIVHRDLKPGNVVLTKAGAKLLDFGLARAAAGPATSSSSTELATEVKPLTSAGTLLGTFQYMAPEQIEGAEADPRTDIFALGALLYEMATGRRAFEGKSKTSLIAAILSSQPPPVSQVQSVMPPVLDHVVRKCLEKDPDDRWQSAHDVATELRWIAETGSQPGVPATLSLRRRSRERLAWGLAAVLAAAAAVGSGWALHLRRAVAESDRVLRAELVLPADLPVAPVVRGSPALSPDGQKLAFVTGSTAQTALAVRDLGSGETRRLEGTDGATFPFWSPDSRWIAFFSDERLRKVTAAGGPVQVVCEAHAGRGGTWSPEGTIVFAPDIEGPLVKVLAGGGSPAAVTSGAGSQVSHRNPWFLPDGRHFLFTLTDAARDGSVAVGSVDGAEPTVLLPRGFSPQYAGGHLFTVTDGTLLAQPFDAGRRVMEGQPLPIAAGVDFMAPRHLASFSVSEGGLLAYRQARRRTTQLVWLDRSGREIASVDEPSYYNASFTVSADGMVLATVRSDSAGANADVWTRDFRRSQPTRSTFLSGPSIISAAVSPDGARLAVSTSPFLRQPGAGIWVQATSGSGSRQALVGAGDLILTDWSADGTHLLGQTQQAKSGFDVAYVALRDAADPIRITSGPYDELMPALSPDGRWVAYYSNETGRAEVFVADFPSGARKWQLSRAGGAFPTWRRDGTEVYFSTEEEVLAVEVVERRDSFEAGAPHSLPFPKRTLNLPSRVYSPDGKRFLVQRFAGDPFTEPIRLIRSWRRIVEK